MGEIELKPITLSIKAFITEVILLYTQIDTHINLVHIYLDNR